MVLSSVNVQAFRFWFCKRHGRLFHLIVQGGKDGNSAQLLNFGDGEHGIAPRVVVGTKYAALACFEGS